MKKTKLYLALILLGTTSFVAGAGAYAASVNVKVSEGIKEIQTLSEKPSPNSQKNNQQKDERNLNQQKFQEEKIPISQENNPLEKEKQTPFEEEATPQGQVIEKQSEKPATQEEVPSPKEKTSVEEKNPLEEKNPKNEKPPLETSKQDASNNRNREITTESAIGAQIQLKLVNPSDTKRRTIDGDKSTFWTSPPRGSQIDFRKHIDYYFDYATDLKELRVFHNQSANERNLYHHYAIYASTDSVNFTKIAYKSDDLLTPTSGDIYQVDFQNAIQLRISLRYNSSNSDHRNLTTLAELEVFGFSKTNSQKLTKPNLVIQDVNNFSTTKEANFRNRFESDKKFQEEAIIQNAQNLAKRIVGERQANNFIFRVTPLSDGVDAFTLRNAQNGKILIEGPNGISLASGFNHYLRNYLKGSFSIFFESNLENARNGAIVPLKEVIQRRTPYQNRYTLNFTTLSYTMAFWGEKEWLQWLDYLALNGINLTLDILGQEEVLRQLFKSYGYSDTQILDYISGPSYFGWFYMQNMTGLGGPLPLQWFEQRVKLARKVHERMLVYGIRPVIPGFSGQVPRNFKEISTTQGDLNPQDVQVLGQGGWVGFNRPAMLRTYDPRKSGDLNDQETKIFKDMATRFYDIQKNLFGQITDFYAVDPFHEGGNRHDMSRGGVNFLVQKRMLAANPKAVWVMQQWQNGIQASDLNQLANKSQALVLDLQSDINPSYAPMENAQVPWVFNMLMNFGGRMGIDGEPLRLLRHLKEARRNNRYLQGIGFVPEAINNSPLMYEMLYDLVWEDNDNYDFDDFLGRYQKARYGEVNENLAKAWDIIMKTALRSKDNYYQGAAEPPIQGRPKTRLGSASTWGHNNLDYRTEAFERALDLFILEFDHFENNAAFMYDFVDLARQVLVNASNEWFLKMISDYQARNLLAFSGSSQKFLDLIRLQEKLLGTHKAFNIAHWIEESQTMLENQDDWVSDLFEFNARALITTWASKAPLLKDYSNRQWAGLTKDLYLGRWELLVERALRELNGTTKENAFNYDWFTFDWKWANRKSNEGTEFAYINEVNGLSAKDLAQEIMNDFSLRAFNKLNPPAAAIVNFAQDKAIQSSLNATPQQLALITNGRQNEVAIFENVTQTAQFTIDLGEEIEVLGFEIWIRQIANIVLLKHRIEILVDSQWVEISSTFDEEKPGFSGVLEIVLQEVRKTSQVRFTFDPLDERAGRVNTLEIADLRVLGVNPSVESQIEITKEANVFASNLANGQNHQAQNVLDGRNSSVWNLGRDMTNQFIGLRLPRATHLSRAVFEFERNGVFGRRFEILATFEDGSQRRIHDRFVNQATTTETTFVIDLSDESQKIQEVFLRFLPGNSDWANVADIHLFTSLELQDLENLQNHSLKSKISLNQENNPALKNLQDNDLETTFKINSQEAKQEIYLELAETEFIVNAQVNFQALNLPAAFQVLAVDDLDLEEIIFDNANNNSFLTTYNFTLNQNLNGLKIVFPKSNHSAIFLKEILLQGLNFNSLPQDFDLSNLENIAQNATLISSSLEGNEDLKASNVLNDSLTSVWNPGQNSAGHYLGFEFDEALNLDFAQFEFEHNNIFNRKFVIEALRENGEYFVILDRSRNATVAEEYNFIVSLKNLGHLKGVRLRFIEDTQEWSNIARAKIFKAKNFNITKYAKVISSNPLLGEKYSAENVLDGDNQTVWNVGQNMTNEFIGLSLKNAMPLERAVFEFERNNVFGRRFEIVATLENGSERVVFDKFRNQGTTNETAFAVDLKPLSSKIKNIFLRFLAGNSDWANVADISLYSSQPFEITNNEETQPPSQGEENPDTEVPEVNKPDENGNFTEEIFKIDQNISLITSSLKGINGLNALNALSFKLDRVWNPGQKSAGHFLGFSFQKAQYLDEITFEFEHNEIFNRRFVIEVEGVDGQYVSVLDRSTRPTIFNEYRFQVNLKDQGLIKKIRLCFSEGTQDWSNIALVRFETTKLENVTSKGKLISSDPRLNRFTFDRLHLPENVLDNDPSTVWNEGQKMAHKFIGIEFNEARYLHQALFEFEKNNVFGRKFAIRALFEDNTIGNIYRKFAQEATTKETTFLVDLARDTRKIKAVFLVFLEGTIDWANVSEIKLYAPVSK